MINEVMLIKLPKIEDPRGNLTYFEDCNHIPFMIKRVFWTYDVPGGQKRGGHAYYKQNEIIIALSGSFDVVITHASGETKAYNLNRSYYGLYIPAQTWRHLENFSTNALSLHASDCDYDSDDYVRVFERYVSLYEK